MSEMKIGMIGAGRMARSLAQTLSLAGYDVTASSSRTYSNAIYLRDLIEGLTVYKDPQLVVDDSDVIFLTVSDSQIKTVCDNIIWNENKTVIHCSGGTSLDALDHAKEQKASVGIMHPCASFTDTPISIRSISFGIAGDEKSIKIIREFAEKLECKTISITDCGLYHAGCCMVSNYTDALLNKVADLWTTMGIDKEETKEALLPMMQSVIDNLKVKKLSECLTGPISRNDTETINKHLVSIDKIDDDAGKIYRVLGRETVRFALSNDQIDAEEAFGLLKILNEKEA
jgi:predicted short-subunit dehydrogenase-like oxidoreductase (DUF2520 family)